jgi:hypothetical protein
MDVNFETRREFRWVVSLPHHRTSLVEQNKEGDVSMNKGRKFKIATVALLIFTSLLFPGPAAKGFIGHARSIMHLKVMIDGRLIDMDIIKQNDRTLAPVRALSEALGAKVGWIPPWKIDEFGHVWVDKGDDRLHLRIGSDLAELNGWTYQLDVPAQIINDRTYLPIRFTAEAMGAGVEWDGATQTVIITSNGQSSVSTKEVAAGAQYIAQRCYNSLADPYPVFDCKPYVKLAMTPAVFQAVQEVDKARLQLNQVATKQPEVPSKPANPGDVLVLSCPTCVAGLGHVALLVAVQKDANTNETYYYSFAPAGADSAIWPGPGHVDVHPARWGGLISHSTLVRAVQDVNAERREGLGKYQLALAFHHKPWHDFEKAMAYAQSIKAREPNLAYFVATYNCLNFVQQALRAAGKLNVPTHDLDDVLRDPIDLMAAIRMPNVWVASMITQHAMDPTMSLYFIP